MRSIIIYFSQTGNTEMVARSIQNGVIQATGQCDLNDIRSVDRLGLKDYDLIGLGAPVIGQCPGNVLDFVRGLRLIGGKHVFTFCTHGTGHKRFLPSLYPVLTEKGAVVIGSADWYGDCFLLHMPQPYPTAGHPDAADLAGAEEYGREMALRSMRIRSGETELIPAAPEPLPAFPKPPEGEKAPEGGKPPVWSAPDFTAMLGFDRAKCLYPDCSLCMDNCPTYGMDLSVDPPVLADPCINCEFCARLCPTGALDMTPWLKAMEDMTAPHMPKMFRSLEEAEQEGAFRRLIPVSEVDVTQTGYHQYRIHPQWVLGKGPNKG